MGKKVIIALYGPENTGKTTTLNLLIGLLGGPERTEDRRLRLTYGRKRIAIATYGDDKKQLDRNINFFKEESCDIYVTATRTEGGSVDALEAFEEDDIGTKAIWIYKSYLTYSELTRGKKGKPLKESITKEQIEIIRNTINEQQAKILKATIDLIIDKWEEQSEDNSSSSDPVTE